MERFARAIVTAGPLLVAGLWITEFATGGSEGWLLGVGLVITGLTGLTYGLWRIVEL